MQRIKSCLQSALLLTTCLSLWHCANPVTPEGGPKDLTPPKVLACDPPNFSTRFKENTIHIEFDEFVNLKNPVTDILVSPPFKNAPDYRLRGKSVVIKLEDTLKANTTYVLTFGKAITDITESNVLTGFSYVFSTGSYIDSLSLKGKVISAFDLTPQKDLFVFLYIDNSDTIPFDSLPVKVPPYYIVRTDDNGEFRFKNLQDAPFKLLALNDQNSNMIFDQPSEKIAFYDTLIRPYLIPTPADTSKKDSSSKVTIKKDSIPVKQDSGAMAAAPLPFYQLRLFEQVDSIQLILKKTVIDDGMVLFLFKFPVKKPGFRTFNLDSTKTTYIQEIFPKRDSIVLWMSGEKSDSLYIEVSDNDLVLDTARLDLRKKSSKKKSSGKDTIPDRLRIIQGKNNPFNLFKYKYEISFSYPLSKWDFSRVLLIEDKDTLRPKIYFSDSLKRKIIIDRKWKEEKRYKIIFPDSICYGINNLTNDSLKIEFMTRGQKDFGSIILDLNVDARPGHYIVQLLTEKEGLIEERFMDRNMKVRFDYILPGKYKIKAILDRNLNRRWDTGNYRLDLQPEEVYYFSKTLEIRANWDIEENWTLN
ncbi:MAG: Ig-like domain-containing protein [bacterium]